MLIPKHFHFIWGGPSMPDHLRANLTLWRDLHPDWDVTLWGDEDLRWLEHHDLFDAAPSLVPADAVWQFRSDLARYEILLKHGGFYADVDTTPLRNIESALEGYDIWAAMEDRNHVGNTYVASIPGHSLMAKIVEGLRASVAANKGRRPNWMTGPRYLTARWVEYGAYAAPPGDWFPVSYMQARRGEQPKIPETAYAVHSWFHVRTMTGQL